MSTTSTIYKPMCNEANYLMTMENSWPRCLKYIVKHFNNYAR